MNNTFYRHFRKEGAFEFYNNELLKGKDITACGIEEGGKLSIGLAITSSEDKFVKKDGRAVAYEHAVESPLVVIPLDSDYSGKVFHNFFNELLMEPSFKNLHKLQEFIKEKV